MISLALACASQTAAGQTAPIQVIDRELAERTLIAINALEATVPLTGGQLSRQFNIEEDPFGYLVTCGYGFFIFDKQTGNLSLVPLYVGDTTHSINWEMITTRIDQVCELFGVQQSKMSIYSRKSETEKANDTEILSYANIILKNEPWPTKKGELTYLQFSLATGATMRVLIDYLGRQKDVKVLEKKWTQETGLDRFSKKIHGAWKIDQLVSPEFLKKVNYGKPTQRVAFTRDELRYAAYGEK
jgi:hypothetical protein